MRRIQRDATHEDFIKSLISGDDPVFRDIWRVLLFGAAYGVKVGKRTPLAKVESNKSFPETYCNTPGWRGFLYLIGFAETESSDHLNNDEEEQDKLMTTFEEYANYGISEMKQRLESSSDRLGEIVSLIEETTKIEGIEPDLTDLDQL